jgi:hypothetical protein
MADQKQMYVKVTRFYPNSEQVMGSFTQRPKEAAVILDEINEAIECDGIGDHWKIEIIQMTEAEYDALPEFVGY